MNELRPPSPPHPPGRRSRRLPVAVSVLSLAIGVSMLAPASASAAPARATPAETARQTQKPNTGGYPYANAVDCAKKYGPGSWCIKGKDESPYGYKYRNSTDYLAWKIRQVFRKSLPEKLGDAATWAARLKADGYTIDKQPRVGDITAWDAPKGSGHVAYVYAVSNGVASLDQYDVNNEGMFSSDRTTAEIPPGTTVTWINPTSPPVCTGSPGMQLPPSIAANPKTGLGVAAADGPSDSLYVYWQNSTGLWQGPYGLDSGAPGIAYSAPAVGVSPKTLLPVVAAEGPSHSLYVYWEDSSGQWLGPLGLDGGRAGIAYSAPAVAFGSNGLPVVLAEGPSNSLYAYWENSNGLWSGPLGVDGGRAGIAYSAPAMSSQYGLPAAVAVGPSNSLYAYWQNSNGSWSGPLGVDGGHGGIAYSAPAEAENPSSKLPTVLADGPSDSLYAYWENSNGQWSGPLGVGGGHGGIAYSEPAIAYNGTTGLPVALAVGASNSLYTYWQNSNGQWVGPGALDNSTPGIAYSPPAETANARTGLPFALVVGPSNSLYAYWQNSNGQWSGPLGVDGGIGCIAY
jgi:surface antigen